MKLIYKVLYPIGFEEHEVEENFPSTIPFVETEPLKLENPQSQFYNFSESRWEEAVTQDYSKKLDLIEMLTQAVQKENDRLKEKTEEQAIQMTDTQLGLAEVYEMLFPADKEMNND